MKRKRRLFHFFKVIPIVFSLTVLTGIGYFAFHAFFQYRVENTILKKMVERLEADSRVAEILVTNVRYDEKMKKSFTTIKFLEYDVKGNPLEPKYFTFSGNMIQFQSLVIRFDDLKIKQGDFFQGKSAYLFLKAFVLNGSQTQEYVMTPVNEIPQGYKLELEHPLERQLWERFWEYALNPEYAKRAGIKNAQLEAPGTVFVPGKLYQLKIEHDGGLRIDVSPLSPIFKGENL